MSYIKGIIAGVLIGAVAGLIYASVTKEIPQLVVDQVEQNVGVVQTRDISLFSGVATTSTSSNISVNGAKRITLLLSRDMQGAASASTTFSVNVSPNGVNYVAYNKLVDNVTNTNAQNLTRVASKALTATGTAMLSFDLDRDIIKFFNVVATRNLDGTSSASALIEY